MTSGNLAAGNPLTARSHPLTGSLQTRTRPSRKLAAWSGRARGNGRDRAAGEIRLHRGRVRLAGSDDAGSDLVQSGSLLVRNGSLLVRNGSLPLARLQPDLRVIRVVVVDVIHRLTGDQLARSAKHRTDRIRRRSQARARGGRSGWRLPGE